MPEDGAKMLEKVEKLIICVVYFEGIIKKLLLKLIGNSIKITSMTAVKGFWTLRN